MIHLLDKSIDTLLKREVRALSAGQIDISFAPPDADFPPASVSVPAVDLFLYDVRENRELRTQEWRLQRMESGAGVNEPPPVRIDCSYLITAWPSSSVPNPTEDEHRILGVVMTALLRYPQLPIDVLPDELKGQEPPLVTTALQPGHLQSLAEFWQAMGGKPKLALNYAVTMSLQPMPAVEVPLVTEKIIRFDLTKERSSSR